MLHRPVSLLLGGLLALAGADALARDDGRRDGRHGYRDAAPRLQHEARGGREFRREHREERGRDQYRGDHRGERHGRDDDRRHAGGWRDGRHDGYRDGYRNGRRDRHRDHAPWRPQHHPAVVHAPRHHGYRAYHGYRHDHRRYRAPVRYIHPHGHRYSGWSVGAYLPPPYFAPTYYIDHYHYGLAPPPRGYRWVRIDNDVVLVALASGLIADVLFDLFYY